MLKWSFKGLPFKHQQWPELTKDAEWWGRETCQVQQKDRKRWTKSRRHYHATSCHHNICHYDLCISLLFFLIYFISVYRFFSVLLQQCHAGIFGIHVADPMLQSLGSGPMAAHGGPWRLSVLPDALRPSTSRKSHDVSTCFEILAQVACQSLGLSMSYLSEFTRLLSYDLRASAYKNVQSIWAKRNTLITSNMSQGMQAFAKLHHSKTYSSVCSSKKVICWPRLKVCRAGDIVYTLFVEHTTAVEEVMV